MENTRKVELANGLRDSGKFREALELFKELESQSKDNPEQAASYLIQEADCYGSDGDTEEAKKCISKARLLVRADPLALAQIGFFEATLLIEDGQGERGLQSLSFILRDNPLLHNSKEGHELYERIQIQRGFSLMHLSRCAEARPILEEASSFRLEGEDQVKSSIHCHLGRCYVELGQYAVAKEQFVLAQRLKVPEDWEDTFHYYYGYTLYELKEFDAARREFILSTQSGSSGPPASYKYKMLAATHRKLGEHSQARQCDDLARLEEPH